MRLTVKAIFLFIFMQESVFSMSGGYAYFNLHQHEDFLSYLITNRQLLLYHPLNHSIEAGELISKLKEINVQQIYPHDQSWMKMLKNDLMKFSSHDPGRKDNGDLDLGGYAGQRLISKMNRQFGEYQIELYGIYRGPNLTLVNRIKTDQAFRKDRTYYGDTSEWILGRVEDAYAKLDFNRFSVFGGRISRNFGFLGKPSLIFSDNPFSYDHLGFHFSTPRLYFAFYFGRLNNLNSFDSQADNLQIVDANRYFSIQRGSLRFGDNLHLGLTQAALYGGENKQLEFFYLNPMNLYYIDQRNNRSQMNGIWAIDFLWLPSSRISLFTQWLIDDVIVNNEPGQNDRSIHPDRMGITFKLMLTDLLGLGSMLHLDYTRIGNWTYMSYRTWENYTYYGRSLGNPENSVESIALKYLYFGKPPFLPQIEFRWRQHGEQDINAVFGDNRDKFPIGIVEHSFEADVKIRYMPSNKFFFDLETKYYSTDNYLNIDGQKKNNLTILFSVFGNVNFDFTF
ncbi:MAG: hypothetical protein JXR49_05110 [Acidobacteria bacterium]|nr:hypothetical protein [Acidobacteriota bacterium]